MASKDSKKKTTETNAQPAGRHHKNPFVYFGTIFILVIVVIAFVFVPAMGGGAGSQLNDLTFGSWRGKPIRFIQDGFFAQQIEEVKRYYDQQGINEENAQFLHYQIWRQAFENTVIHTALLDSARQNNIQVSDDYLDKQMAVHPYFVEGGSFSLRRYRETPTHVKASIRSGLEENAIKGRYVGDLIPVLNKAETAFITAMAGEERSIDFVNIALDSYPDSERLAFAAANPAPFRQVKFSRLTLQGSEREAIDILAKLRDGSLDFEEAARIHSRDSAATRGGSMDWRYAWELRSDFDNPLDLDALIDQPAGYLSEVLPSVSGSWLIFRVDEASRQADSSAADYLATISSYMTRFEKGRIEDWALDQAADFLAGYQLSGLSFEDFAASEGRSSTRTNAFPLNYGKVFDLGYFALFDTIDESHSPHLTSAHTNIPFLQAVFGLEAGEVGQPVLVGNSVIAFQLAEIRQAEDTKLGLIEGYFPYLLQETLQAEITEGILKHPNFKDEFMNAYFRNFSL